MEVPSATYRVQLHAAYTFNDLQQTIDYLHQLGISTIYASPVTKAVPGSMHGYDVADSDTINPEIGTLDQWRGIAQQLKEKNMSWLQDIVPNHMAFSPENARLMDVLERGNRSEYYQYFDIDWDHPAPDLNNRLMVPFLGGELLELISKGDIALTFSDNGFSVKVYSGEYPLSITAYPTLVSAIPDYDGADALRKSLLQLAASAASDTPAHKWSAHKRKWAAECRKNKQMMQGINETISLLNTDKNKLLELLQQQNYTLAYWKRASREINYRRFFTVNSLICLRMEDEPVFNEYHRFFKTCWQEGLVQGFRIDHIDGLYDPARYIERLRKLFGKDCYIIAEKILETGEKIPAGWQLQGTSGYEFLEFISQLLTDVHGAIHLHQFYRLLLPESPTYEEIVTRNKSMILEQHMAGEWENLTRLFTNYQLPGNYEREKIKQALAALMVALPVYRIYPDNHPLEEESVSLMKKAFESARRTRPECVPELLYLELLMLNPGPGDEWPLLFLQRLMQFTGPLMAKGVEDTTFYMYNAHISHNEVGDDPSVAGIAIDMFHATMLEKQRHIPLSLNATATHDTKRGEDARLRINVLSELSEAWQQKVEHWLEMNAPLRKQLEHKTAPEMNDEYFFYQSIVGGFPEDHQITGEWIKRLEDYVIKMLRESKVNSNWDTPDEAYESACTGFVRQLFNKEHGFVKDLLPFVKQVCRYGAVYSLAQVAIKITAPGIPDIYQGCELWDLSFVDPDNRRPVDYTKRKKMLATLQEKEKAGTEAGCRFASGHWQEGYEKLLLTWKLLNYRRMHNELFLRGDYIPLTVTGQELEAVAFARRADNRHVVTVVPVAVVSKYADPKAPKQWNNSLVMPRNTSGTWTNIITGEQYQSPDELALADLFRTFPVAVLEQQ